jgi:tRNA threonylcarbamoyladenosine biosynthesis protein TsaE
MKIISLNSSQTKKIGRLFGQICLDFLKENNFQGPLVILLSGDLGSGKTTFIKGFAKSFGIKEKEVISPTFIIYNKFSLKNFFLYHFDLYRIKHKRELSALGFQDILRQKNAIILIEWAQKMKDYKFGGLPVVQIFFEHLKGDKRSITINAKSQKLKPKTTNQKSKSF